MKLRHIIFACLLCAIGLLQAQEIKWYNPMEKDTPVLHGQAWQDELAGTYERLPDRLESKVSKNVWNLSKNSAGEKLIFRTNSTLITIRYATTSKDFAMPHMPATGVSGVDLYAVDENGKWNFCRPKYGYTFGDTCKYCYKEIIYPQSCQYKGFEYHLYLPLYNGVKWLEIGVEDGSILFFEPVSIEKPIVVYGTSIVQGACASRPGMAWTNIVERKLQHSIINLGFNGSALMEEGMQEVLDELDPTLYILDNMENMKAENVFESSMNCCHKLRKSHPNTPILLVEHNGQPDLGFRVSAIHCVDINKELKRVYKALTDENMPGVYYLSCEELGLNTESFVEGVHPSDYGMVQTADAVIKKVKEILHEDCSEDITPCTQNRDPYMWRQRHEQVLKLNAEHHPDAVLIGNSITHYWGGEPTGNPARNQDAWKNMSNGLDVHNLGFGWDRVENILWRIYHGELDGYDAKYVFLLGGCNNIVFQTPEQVADGMIEILKAVKVRQPKAKIYQCGLMPRQGWGAQVLEVNERLQKLLKDFPDVTYVSLDELGEKDGTLKKIYSHDGTHPNAAGYDVEAKILGKFLK